MNTVDKTENRNTFQIFVKILKHIWNSHKIWLCFKVLEKNLSTEVIQATFTNYNK